MADVWICNSSPLSSLSRIGHLDLVESLAPKVIVPATVLRELEAGEERDGASRAVKSSPRLQDAPDVTLPEAVSAWRLDPGESQVLALALLEPGRGVIIDDRAARRCAASLAIPMIGTIGIVALARQRNLIGAVAPVFRALRNAGLFVAPSIEKAVLAELGEEIE